MAVATGNAMLLGLARELAFGVPDDENATLEYLKPILPLAGGLVPTSAEGGEVNQSGFNEPDVPGPINGALEFGARFSAAALLSYFEHLLRGAAKSTLEAGVYEYVFTPDLAGVDTSFAGILASPPVDQHRIYGVKFGQMQMTIGNNTGIAARLKGFVSHGTRVGAATADVGNTGTYTVAPVIRGLLASETPTADLIFVKVTKIAGGDYEFKVERCDGDPAPTYPGTAIDIALDSDGAGVWQNLPDSAGLDLGLFTENRDPIEIIWPGGAVELAKLAVGDVWSFPITWSLPTATYLAGQRFTSAHQINRFRAVGGPTWDEFRTLTTQLTLAWPLTVEQGSGSRYYYALDRDGKFSPSMQITRRHTDRDFVRYFERHDHFEAETEFQGQLLANGPYRESIKIEWANVAVKTLARPATNDRAITETINLQGETNADGDPPVVITVITDRDFTLAT